MNLSANATALNRTLDGARRSVLGFAMSTKAMIVGAAGAFGIGLSTVAIKNWIGNQADAVDATGKLAAELGMTTRSLSGLQHAAGLAGVDTNLLTIGLRKLTNNLADATKKGNATGRAMAELKLDPAKLLAGDPGEAFEEIAESISGVEDPFRRASLAADIFGEKAGPRLLSLMMSGAAGIRQARDEAQRMGLTFSELDFARVEQGNDAISRLQGLAAGAGRTVAIQLAPMIDSLSTKLFGAATAGEGFGVKVASGFEQASIAAAKTLDFINQIEAKRAGTGNVIAIKTTELELGAARSRVSNLKGQLVPGANTPEKFRAGFAAQLEEERSRVQILEAQLKSLNAPAEALTNHAEETAKWFADQRESAKFVESYTSLMAGSMFDFGNGAERGASAVGEMATNLDRSANAMHELEKRVASFNASQFKNMRGLEQMMDALERQAGGGKPLKPPEKEPVKPPAFEEDGRRLAAAVERRFTFTTNNDRAAADPVKVAERQLREQEQTRKKTEAAAGSLNSIDKKLGTSGSIAIFTLN